MGLSQLALDEQVRASDMGMLMLSCQPSQLSLQRFFTVHAYVQHTWYHNMYTTDLLTRSETELQLP